MPWPGSTRESSPEPIPTSNTGGCRNNRWRRRSGAVTPRRTKLKAPMGSLVVVVPQVLVADPLEVATTPDQHPVQTLLSNHPHPPLGMGVDQARRDCRQVSADRAG